MHIRDNLTWPCCVLCWCVDEAVTAGWLRATAEDSSSPPATSPASTMSRRCPIVAWLRPAAILDTPFSYSTVHRDIYISIHLRDAWIPSRDNSILYLYFKFYDHEVSSLFRCGYEGCRYLDTLFRDISQDQSAPRRGIWYLLAAGAAPVLWRRTRAE